MQRRALDVAQYEHEARAQPCFICRIVDGTHDFPHGEIYRDEVGIAFLNRYPTMFGYTLVAPIEHRCGVISDFGIEEYLALQRIVHRVGSAITRVVPTERLYVLSVGSNDGNAHVHWHLAPLPPGVPYEEQQFSALIVEDAGYLDLSGEEHARLAAEISAALERLDH